MMIYSISQRAISCCIDLPKKYLPPIVVKVGLAAASSFSVYAISLVSDSPFTFVATVLILLPFPLMILRQHKAESIMLSSIFSAAALTALTSLTSISASFWIATYMTSFISMIVFFGFERLEKRELAKTEALAATETYLESYFLHEPKRKQYDDEILSGNYENFIRLMNSVIDGSYIDVLKKGSLFPWFLSHIEVLINNSAITDDQCHILHEKLVKAAVFDDAQERVIAICSNNTQVQINKMALLLASSVFRAEYKKSSQLNLETFSSEAMMKFARFIVKLEDVTEAIDYSSECDELLALSKLYIYSNTQAYHSFTSCVNRRMESIGKEDELEKALFLSEPSRENIDQEIAKGDYKRFLAIIDALIDGSCLPVLRRRDGFSWFLSKMEDFLKSTKLTDPQLEQLHISLAKANAFNDTQETVTVNTQVKINKIALLLASPYFRTQYFGGWKDSRNNQLNLKDVNSEMLKKFAGFVANGQVIAPSKENLDENVDLGYVANLFLNNNFKKQTDYWFTLCVNAQVESIWCENTLLKYLEYIAKYQKIDEELFAKMQYEAFSHFYSQKFGGYLNIPFYLGEDCFTLPLNALHLLDRNDLIGQYLKETVNCLILPKEVTAADCAKLKMLGPQELQNFKYLAFNNNSGVEKVDQIVVDLPNIEAFYALVTGTFFANDLIKLKEKYSAKPLKVVLEDSSLSIDDRNIQLWGNTASLEKINLFEFINFSERCKFSFPSHYENNNALVVKLFNEKYGEEYLFEEKDGFVCITEK